MFSSRYVGSAGPNILTIQRAVSTTLKMRGLSVLTVPEAIVAEAISYKEADVHGAISVVSFFADVPQGEPSLHLGVF